MNDRYLIIGLGSIGRRHAANLRALRPHAHIGALRSGASGLKPSPDVDEQIVDWEQALAFGPSAAIVCSPASQHLDAARKLLAARVPMLIEKPLANSTSGLCEFLAEVRRVGLPVAVGYNLRFSPSLRHVRELIRAGIIGEVVAARAEVGQYLPDWRPQARYQDGVSARGALGGGPLLELSHELDYLHWMFGIPAEASATGGRLSDLEIDVEDAIEVNLAYRTPNRLFNVHLDFLQRAPDRRCRFIGTSGSLVWDAISETIDIYRVSTQTWEQIHVPVRDSNQIYRDELSAFFDLMAGEVTSLAHLEDAYDVLAVVEAAVSSMAKQATVKVNGFAQRSG